ATTGWLGIHVVDGSAHRLINNTLISQRNPASYGATQPAGIVIDVDKCSLIGNQIEGFYSDSSISNGIILLTGSDFTTISGGHIDDSGRGIWGQSGTSTIQVTGVRFRRNKLAAVETMGDNAIIENCYIYLDTTEGVNGVVCQGNDSIVRDCIIKLDRAWPGATGLTPHGVVFNGVTRGIIGGCTIENFYNDFDDLGYGVRLQGTCEDITISNVTVEKALVGISLADTSDRTQISNVNLKRCGTGANLAGADCTLSDSFIDLGTGTGTDPTPLNGVLMDGTNLRGRVVNTNIQNRQSSWAGVLPTPVGIEGGSDATISGCTVEGFYNTNTSTGFGILLLSAGGKVVGNTCIQNHINIAVDQGVTDVQITSNRCHGGYSGSISAIGINVEGRDVFGDRTRNIVIADNNVRSFTLHGIRLRGYVQNGTISGNTVDGYLDAAPFIPSGTGIKIEATITNPDMASYNTVANNTVWRCAVGIHLVGLNAEHLTNIAVNGNAIHQIALAGAFSSNAIIAQLVDDLTCNNNVIYDLGIIINEIGTPGAPAGTIGCRGIYTYNCNRVTIDGNSIRNVHVSGAAGGSAIVCDMFNATVDPDFESLTISDNTISQEAGLAQGMTFGISVFCTIGTGGGALANTLTGLVISGNNLKNTEYGGIQVKSSTDTAITNVAIEGNLVHSVLNSSAIAGIDLVTEGTVTAGSLWQVLIADNVIAGVNLASAAAVGIRVLCDELSPVFGAFTIRDNEVLGCNNGILYHQQDLLLAGLKISGNRAEGAGDYAIKVAATVVNETTIISGSIELSGNSAFMTPASTTGHAIHLEFHGWTSLVKVQANLAFADAANGSTGRPLFLDVDYAPNFLFPLFWHRGYQITDNILEGGIGTRFDFEGDVGLRNFKVADNEFKNSQDQMCQFNITNDDAPALGAGSSALYMDMTFHDNSFDNSDYEGLVLNFANVDPSNSTYAAIRGISVQSNIFTKVATGLSGAGLYVSSRAKIGNLTIANNQFYYCGPGGAAGSGTIGLAIGGTTAGTFPTLFNTRVSGNTFSDCGGVGVYMQRHVSATQYTVANFEVSNNNFSNQASAPVLLNLLQATQVDNVVVNQNIIHTVTNTAGYGILITGPSSGTTTNLSVSGNTIKDVDLEGINLGFLDLLVNGRVDGNSVDGSGDQGIQLLLEDFQGVSVSGNTVNDAGSDSIEIEAAAGGESLTVNGNTTHDGAKGILLDFNAGVEVLAVCGNSIYNPTGVGIDCDFESSLTSVNVNSNAIYGGGSQGSLYFHGAASDIEACTFNGNTISTVADGGIVIITSSGDLIDIAVVGNSIRNWNLDANTGSTYTFRSAIYVATATGATRCISIGDNNIVQGDQAGSTGIFMGPVNAGSNTAFDAISIIGNNIFTSQISASTTGILYDTNSSTTGREHTISGNNVRGPRTTANAFGSFAADKCVVVGNSASEGDGANYVGGGWATWVAADFTNVSNETAHNAD
ncbi:right-handed parallel beta-helix repeat-containing protein, partial [Deltaproteobacteria bacterium]|nr:right-handed parallel beta-helix repeat-containing protein [Deltaproteobacteria bacterium]